MSTSDDSAGSGGGQRAPRAAAGQPGSGPGERAPGAAAGSGPVTPGAVTPVSGESTEEYDTAARPPSSARRAWGPAGPEGRYIVVDEHARGGIGRVLRARDVVLGRMVAIKELLNPSDQAEARFVREARITARLEHPAIVPVHDAGRWPGSRRPYYAMKLVSGRPLKDIVEAARSLEERLSLLPNLLAVAEAVAYAHAARIVHRDLKPANVIVGAYGETAVIDWGLAKDLAEAEMRGDGAEPYRSSGAPDLTQEGAILGTPLFMSPEQARGEEVDETTDVYALGAMIYYVVCGQPPYTGDQPDVLLAQIRSLSPTPIGRRVSDVPADLAAIVDKAMAWHAAARYRTAEELARDLKRFLTGQRVGAHVYSRRQLIRRWVRRNRGLSLLTACFALAAILGSAWFLVREQRLRHDAEAERDRAEGERGRADQQTLALLEQSGRRELDLGRPFRASVYLAEAYRRDPSSPVLRWLVTQAVAPLAAHRFSLLGHERDVVAVAWSADGSRLATGSSDTTVRLWDAATGRALTVLRGHTRGIEDVAFSPDGALLASVGAGDFTIVWDAATGAERHRFPGGGFRAAFSPDGASLVIGGKDGRLSVRDVASGAAVFEATPHKDRVAAIVFHPEGGRMFTAGWDGRMTFWDVRTWKPIRELPPIHGMVVEAAFSSDGRWLLTCDADVTLQIRRADTGEIDHAILLPDGARFKNAWFSPDGRLVLTTSSDGVLRVWHTGSGALLRSIDAVAHGKLFDTAISPAGDRILTSGQDRADAWDVTDPDRVLAGGESGEFFPCALYPGVFTGDGARFIAGLASEERNEIRVWDPRTGALLTSWPETGPPFAVATNRDGTRVLVSSPDGKAPRLRDDRGALIAELHGHTDIVYAASASADGSVFATASYDRSVRFWRSATGEPIGPALSFDRRPTSVAFSPDGAAVAVADEFGRVSLWRRDSGALLRAFPAHPTWIQDIEYSRDGATLVTAGRQDHTAITWDAATGARRRAFIGHGDNLMRASVSPDGTLVATTSVDGTARLWDERTGQLLRVIRGPSFSAEFSPDGTHLFTTGLKEFAAIWDIRLDPRAPSAIAALVAARSPWRLGDGRLTLR